MLYSLNEFETVANLRQYSRPLWHYCHTTQIVTLIYNKY